MPKFTFTSPDGKNYEIQGPDGATQEQAFGILQQQLGNAKPSTNPMDPSYQSLAGQIPKDNRPGLASTPQPQAPAPKLGGVTDVLKGAGETALSLGSSAVAGPVGAARGVYEGLTGGKYGTQAGTKEAEKKGSELAQSMTYTPKTESGKAMTGALGDFFKAAGLEGLGGLGGELGALGQATKAAKPILAAKAGSALEKTGELASKAKTAIAESPEAGLIGRGVNKLASSAYSKEALQLAQKAQDYGIEVRPDMLSNNKIVKMMGEALEKVPLSGAKTEARQEAFNKALIKQIGGDPNAKKLTSDVFGNAIQKSGKEIGRIGEQYGVNVDAAVETQLKDFAKQAKSFETKDVRNIVNSYVKEIKDKTENGTIDGTAFKKINSKLGRQMRATSNGDLKNALGDLQEIMHDALGKSIPKEDLAAWNTARTQYAKAKTIEPLVAKTTTGDISGPSLMARVTADKAGKSRMAQGAAGEMGDLARIGQLIKEPASSGTAERNLAYGLLGGAGYANPLATAGVYGAANLYNRFGQMLIPKPPKTP